MASADFSRFQFGLDYFWHFQIKWPTRVTRIEWLDSNERVPLMDGERCKLDDSAIQLDKLIILSF